MAACAWLPPPCMGITVRTCARLGLRAAAKGGGQRLAE
jgi:hypothetical protein